MIHSLLWLACAVATIGLIAEPVRADAKDKPTGPKKGATPAEVVDSLVKVLESSVKENAEISDAIKAAAPFFSKESRECLKAADDMLNKASKLDAEAEKQFGKDALEGKVLATGSAFLFFGTRAKARFTPGQKTQAVKKQKESKTIAVFDVEWTNKKAEPTLIFRETWMLVTEEGEWRLLFPWLQEVSPVIGDDDPVLLQRKDIKEQSDMFAKVAARLGEMAGDVKAGKYPDAAKYVDAVEKYGFGGSADGAGG